MEKIAEGEVVWRPSKETVEKAQMTALIRSLGCKTYDEVNARATEDPEWFWDGLLKFIDFRFYKPYDKVLDISKGKAWAKWCVGGTTNAYLNCIEKHKGTPIWTSTALDWEGEDGRTRSYSYEEFDAEASKLAAALKSMGVKKGDIVGLHLPMIPEVYIAYMANLKIGAVNMPLFSGFGPAPIAVRINDGGCKIVITADGTWRRGEPGPMKVMLDEAAEDCPDLKDVIVVRHLGEKNLAVEMKEGRDVWWHDVVAGQPTDLPTEELPAEWPERLAFTSGTTGKPKGIIQTHVGFTTKIALDVNLCSDFVPGDSFMWLSDFGWMVGAMTAIAPTFGGGRVVVAEGAPDYPDIDRFWRLIEDYKVTHFGIAPTAQRGCMKYGKEPVEKHDLSSLKCLITGGEPATPDAWNWTFEVVGKKKIPVLNMSGGTEIGCSIVTGSYIHPLKPCAFNGSALGSGAAVLDEQGNPVKPGEVGELVLLQPSIGLTRSFWGEGGDERYLETYWSDYKDIWRHGDFAAIDEDGFWYILGRSDDTIKVSGKRTGPSEIESLAMATGKLADVAAIGLPDQMKGSAVGLIAIPAQGVEGDDALRGEISNAVVEGMGRSYRPREIHFVPDLPRTRSMKVMRRVIRSVLLDEPAGDLSSLVNPEALDWLKNIK